MNVVQSDIVDETDRWTLELDPAKLAETTDAASVPTPFEYSGMCIVGKASNYEVSTPDLETLGKEYKDEFGNVVKVSVDERPNDGQIVLAEIVGGGSSNNLTTVSNNFEATENGVVFGDKTFNKGDIIPLNTVFNTIAGIGYENDQPTVVADEGIDLGEKHLAKGEIVDLRDVDDGTDGIKFVLNTIDGSDNIVYDWMKIPTVLDGIETIDTPGRIVTPQMREELVGSQIEGAEEQVFVPTTFWAGNVGEVSTHNNEQKITGQLFYDENNNGHRDDTDTAAAGINVGLERYYTVVEVAQPNTWTVDNASTLVKHDADAVVDALRHGMLVWKQARWVSSAPILQRLPLTRSGRGTKTGQVRS